MSGLGHEGDRRGPIRGCIPFVAIGCGILEVLALAAGAFIVLRLGAGSNSAFLDSLAELFGAATTQGTAMAELKQDLASRYPAEDIGVPAETRTIFGSNQASLSLDVEFVNPSFVALAQGPQTAEVAHDIAVYVASTYPDIEGYDVVSITLLFRTGVMGTSATYRFDVSELRGATGTPQQGL
jgi:hypothetical protein